MRRKRKGAYQDILGIIQTCEPNQVLTSQDVIRKFPTMSHPARHSAILNLKKDGWLTPDKKKGVYLISPTDKEAQKKPVHELPDIDVVQGGEILFGYIDHLRHNIGDLENDLKEEKERHSYDVRKLKELINELTNKANKLEKQLETAQGALRGRSSENKKFSLAEIAKFTNRR